MSEETKHQKKIFTPEYGKFIQENSKEDRYTAHTVGIDHDQIITADKRTGSASYSMAMLCKQDKEQLDRIEAKLDKLLGGEY